MNRPPGNRRVAAVASLGDETRRRLFDFVAAAGAAVGRVEAARALELARSTVSFHLDGLCRTDCWPWSSASLAAGTAPGPAAGQALPVRRPGGGRPVPDRNYDLAAELLATAVEASAEKSVPAREALAEAAYARGRATGHASGAAEGFARFLAASGYQPENDGEGGLVLVNCPFHRLAAGHTDLVCAMNGAFLNGAAAGCGVAPDRVEELDTQALRAGGAARPGQCCARIRLV